MDQLKGRIWMMGVAVAVLAVLPGSNARAQAPTQAALDAQWQTRSWPELKAETQARVDRNRYPLHGLKPEDVREALSHIDSLDRDQWAAAFMAIGDRYRKKAEAELAAHPEAAREDYRQAWLNYAFGRWPSPNSLGKREAEKKAEAAFIAYGQLTTPKIEVLRVPFEGKTIIAYLQKPLNVAKPPVVLDIGGADEWKDAAAADGRRFLEDGIADVAVDMPGTGDSPLPGRPGSERMYSALIDYLLTRHDLDASRIVARGVSWGSYWSVRVAYAEPTRLKGAVFQGGQSDEYFTRAWQEKALHTKEYLNDFVGSRLFILSQPSVEALLDFLPSMSLKPLIDKPTAPMLLIEGVHDSQNPFSDTELLLEHGSPKYAWVNPEGGHMGRSKTISDEEIFDEIVRPWILARLTQSHPAAEQDDKRH
jgi:pimeloyl-ACP methyl ester carboxylesterase